MLNIGEIITLSDNKEYVVVNIINLHSINYVYLMTNKKPVEIVIATEKMVDGNLVLDEVKDNSELDYILSRFSLEKDIAETD